MYLPSNALFSEKEMRRLDTLFLFELSLLGLAATCSALFGVIADENRARIGSRGDWVFTTGPSESEESEEITTGLRFDPGEGVRTGGPEAVVKPSTASVACRRRQHGHDENSLVGGGGGG